MHVPVRFVAKKLNVVTTNDDIDQMSVYCRQELNVRLTANLLLAFCAWHPPCRPYMARYFSASVRLPSDWMQIADLVMTFPEVAGGSLPAALRKAMVEKFEEFDEYQLAKYNRERKGIMVRKTICMYVHVYVTDNP